MRSYLALCLIALLGVKSIQAQECSSNFHQTISYLYWGAQEDQLEFALAGAMPLFTGPATGPVSLASQGSSWGSGVRLEGGIPDCCFPLEYLGSWTYLYVSSNASAHNVAVTASSGQLNDTPFFPAEEARSHWQLTLNEASFDIAYLEAFSSFSLRPFAGVFGAVLNQKQHIDYLHAVSKGSDDFNLTVLRKIQFWGIGPRAGLNLTWMACGNWGFECGVNGAYLVGRFDITNTFDASDPVILSEFPPIYHNLVQGRPMVDGKIGFLHTCECDRYRFVLSIAYEFQYWWQQWNSSSNFFLDLVAGGGLWGDLSLQGLVASGSLFF